jgi:hypothetical protein
MDINILVQRLQHGESFAAQNADGEPYQVNRPPSSLSINAAKVIIALDQQVKQLNDALLNVQAQLNQLSSEYESFRTNNPTAKTS